MPRWNRDTSPNPNRFWRATVAYLPYTANLSFDHAAIALKLEQNSMPEPNSGCILWLRYCNDRGYGNVRIDQHTVRLAHRVAWHIAYGPIPAGLAVCHKCDVPNCINPQHLFLGTNADNVADKVAKGRATAPRGSSHYRARLTEAQVAAIRADPRTHRKIANAYGVSFGAIDNIKAEKSWAHLTSPVVRVPRVLDEAPGAKLTIKLVSAIRAMSCPDGCHCSHVFC